MQDMRSGILCPQIHWSKNLLISYAARAERLHYLHQKVGSFLVFSGAGNLANPIDPLAAAFKAA